MIKLVDILKEHIDSGRVRLSDFKFDGILKDKYSWLLEEVNEIEEGVSKTHGIQDSINQLQFHIHNVEFKEDRGKIICKLHRDVDTDLIQSILSFSYNLGYFPSYFTPKSNIFKPLVFSEREIVQYIKNNDIYSIILDAMFDVSLNSFEIPKTTYHITQSIHKDKILKIGLCPKTKTKIENHPDRIYLMVGAEGIRDLLKNVNFYLDKKTKKPISEFVIFEIDTEKLKRKISFYDDKSFEGKSIYTKNNIPPNYIKVYRTIKYDTDLKGYKE